MPSLTPEQKDEVCRLYPESRGLKELAKRFGVSSRTIAKALEAGGVPRQRKGRPSGYRPKSRFTDKHVQWMVELYEDGHSLREIGDIVGCSYELVRQLLDKRGVERSKLSERGQRLRAELEDVKRLYEGGMSSTEIADRYDVAGKTVLRTLHQVGVPIRAGGGSHDPQHDEEAAALYREGHSVRDVANMLGIGERVVYAGLLAQGVDMRPFWHAIAAHQRKYTPEQIEEMVGLYRDHGMTMKAVAERMGCHVNTVRYWLKRRGVPIRGRWTYE